MSNSKRSTFRLSLALGILGAALAGCGSGGTPDGLPELHPLTLSVNQGGAPIEGVSVQMIPENPSNSRWACGGATDATGKVIVKTLGRFEGAPAGNYKVTFFKTFVEDMNPGVAADDPSSSKVYNSYLLIDPKFGSTETTPIEVNVAGGETTVPPIELGPAVKIKQANM
ncbi:carboxypeptidase regulatory-like domain-containing protein [Stieleria sp. TO1_6]|uniref:carboxypeptidase regulatory-like domain-containing protein n=1 Tax=Stieleria tagensis TaxID=2956795 RepID=UPI00209BA51F|nr:carboxypeptidase regulatory-like domain-containing protein [Stieleria tagensis]MCO8121346.1 carboxypeptidase regulatory-like domain-containing protein [Stieleria tagensis]